MRVPEGVLEPCRDQGDGGRNGIEERLDARSARAVVADLEDVGVESGAGRHELGFDDAFHIAGEQERS